MLGNMLFCRSNDSSRNPSPEISSEQALGLVHYRDVNLTHRGHCNREVKPYILSHPSRDFERITANNIDVGRPFIRQLIFRILWRSRTWKRYRDVARLAQYFLGISDLQPM